MDTPLIICITSLTMLGCCYIGKCYFYNSKRNREVNLRQKAINLIFKRTNQIANIDEEIKEEPIHTQSEIRYPENV